MKEKYLVFTGNEMGIGIGEYEKFLTLDKAEQLYQEYIDEYECAAMYAVKDDGIELVKSYCEC